MKWLFWTAAAVVAYTYVGYPAWLLLRRGARAKPVKRELYRPFISLVMVVRNEAEILEQKLGNLLALEYPAGGIEYVIASDGSTDGTEAVLRKYVERPEFRVILNHVARGKAANLNDAVEISQGEVLVFTDARQMIERDAVATLLENFADPIVGAVSGELMLGDPNQGESTRGMGLYWRIEKSVRLLESESGSTVGATGAFYAVRRALWKAMPENIILDDVYVPMNVVRQGFRVILDPRARAWDVADQGAEREFARKVRTLSGNYQLLRLCPWLLTGENPIRLEFISHKVLRLLVPLALIATFFSSLLIGGTFYRFGFLLQLAFYGSALLAAAKLELGPLTRIADAALTFVLLNAAAALAFCRFIAGRETVWSR